MSSGNDTLLVNNGPNGSTHSNNGGFPSNYDNSKQLRRESSVYEQALTKARSPAEIISSFYSDCSWALARDFVVSFVVFFFGSYVPKNIILPFTGVNHRPIPYQLTQAGDVLLDLTLANELVPKSDVVFPGRYSKRPCAHQS